VPILLACGGPKGCGWQWEVDDGHNPDSPVKCPRCRKSKKVPRRRGSAARLVRPGPRQSVPARARPRIPAVKRDLPPGRTRPGGRELIGVPIPPQRPAVPQPVNPKPVLAVRTEPVATQRGAPEPGYGRHLVPEFGPWCEVCSFMGWRNDESRFARATVALEMLRDGRILVCGRCATRIRNNFRGEVLAMRKLPGQPASPRNGAVYRAAGPGKRPVP
jgi:hypothetical protein